MSKSATKKKAASGKAPDGWEVHNGTFYKIMNETSTQKVAGFDFDGTLAKTKSGAKFTTGPDDWEFWDVSVPETLKAKLKAGFRLVIFSNQMGVIKDKTTPKNVATQFENLRKAVDPDIKIDMFFATQEDGDRKPSVGMWDLFVELCCGGVEPELKDCIYVGDGAGRIAGAGQRGGKKDFSCSDRKFAFNVGMQFQTPEEFFLHAPIAKKFEFDGFDPLTLKEDALLFPKLASDSPMNKNPSPETIAKDPKTKQELVVLVGSPASGKSTFTKKYFIPCGYIHVNRDTLGDIKKCISACDTGLRSGKSVVIDNTNPKSEDRKTFIQQAKSKGISVRMFYFPSSFDRVQHVNTFRERLLGTEAPHIPTIALCMFFKNLVVPESAVKEGVDEVIEVAFVPEFGSENDRRLFYHKS
ncbi:MAG: putative Bifunctional polynucleotide phosphatase/kinase [Streblomastix strix]|uniref:Putative Bifunctional polynucleotide phosphatase/kinase n=1 Tax=Streblomastix strix TaxID=222440 RepID=A0A5J4VSL9_9EUKA|nr:MAG: putative Bifunctional polynucleotide phosphatase/kinase [Streblomastix strix]